MVERHTAPVEKPFIAKWVTAIVPPTSLSDTVSGIVDNIQSNMEIVKYLCEFFFTNFWHWLGLVVILAVVFRFGLVSFITDNSRKTVKRDEEEED